jgi:hypothetical protein
LHLLKEKFYSLLKVKKHPTMGKVAMVAPDEELEDRVSTSRVYGLNSGHQRSVIRQWAYHPSRGDIISLLSSGGLDKVTT